jgi:hypothetical protein
MNENSQQYYFIVLILFFLVNLIRIFSKILFFVPRQAHTTLTHELAEERQTASKLRTELDDALSEIVQLKRDLDKSKDLFHI